MEEAFGKPMRDQVTGTQDSLKVSTDTERLAKTGERESQAHTYQQAIHS